VQPGLAYRWLAASPSFGPADHRRVRELVVDAAQAGFDTREFGSFNRSMQAALGYELAARIAPDHPDASAWHAYAEQVWDSFRRAGDTREDSSSYTMRVFVPAMLGYALVTGRDAELFGDPRFHEWIERLYDQTFPLGVQPDFGDGAGWARDGGGAIWLFEKAAARYHEPRFRWLAQRIFDYEERAIRDRPPASDSMQESLSWLAMAYLDADETLTAIPPKGLHEVALEVLPAARGPLVLAAGVPEVREFRLPAGRLAGFTLDLETAAAVRLWATLRASAGELLYSEQRDLVAGRERIRLGPLLPDAPAGGRRLELRSSGEVTLHPLDGDGAGDWLGATGLVGAGSKITRRASGAFVPKIERRPGSSTFHFDGGRVPSKLVLRSGMTGEDLSALFNLVRGYGHGQEERGALVGLVDGGSLLLQDTPTPYWFHVRRREDESAPLLRRYAGATMGEAGSSVEIASFIDGRAVTLAALRWKDAGGWKVGRERRIVFVKNRMLLVRDRVRFHDATWASAGSVWHPAKVFGRAGGGFDVGHPFPQSNVWLVRNPHRRLWMQLIDRAGRKPQAFVDASSLPPSDCPAEGTRSEIPARCRSGPPWVIAQRAQVRAGAGDELWFDTLLLPHAGRVEAGDLASRVRVHRAAGSELALEVAAGDETWWLIDRPGMAGRRWVIDDIESDARTLVARTAPGRPYFFVDAAHELRLGALGRRWPAEAAAAVEEGVDGPLPRQEQW